MSQGSRLDRWRSGGGEGPEPPPDDDAPLPTVEEGQEEPLGDPRQYKAFHTMRGPIASLQIRRVLGAWHSPYYPFLMNVSCDANYGTDCVLFYSFMQVELQGRNLQRIIKAIHEKRCAWIQDFHPEEHDAPGDDDPVITHIRIVTKESAEAMSEAERKHTQRVTDARGGSR